MKKYKNYIFDLYGTLIDIETNENGLALWKKMAGLYSVYGADYSWRELKKRYSEYVQEEEEILREETGYTYPEIKLEKVFARLYLEAPVRHNAERNFSSRTVESLEKSDFIHFIANAFRVTSRKKCHAYRNTHKVLETLMDRGCGIYLLSNAQRIFTMPEIEQTGLMNFFDDIFISSDLGIKKPQPEFMRKLLNDNDLKIHDSVMVGNDYDSDIGIAASVGMDSIFLNTFDLSEKERDKRLNDMRKRTGAAGYSPVLTVADGDIGKILE